MSILWVIFGGCNCNFHLKNPQKIPEDDNFMKMHLANMLAHFITIIYLLFYGLLFLKLLCKTLSYCHSVENFCISNQLWKFITKYILGKRFHNDFCRRSYLLFIWVLLHLFFLFEDKMQPTKFLKICFKNFIAVGKVRRSNSSCGAKLKKRCSFFISCVVKILP